MAETLLPLMPPLHELPDALQSIKDGRQRAFAWFYVFGGGNGADAAERAGYSNHKEACKVRAHYLLQRDDINDAIKALTTKYLFSLAPKAIFRLEQILDQPTHAKHIKAIELTLDRAGHGAKSEVEVNHTLTINHTDQALEDLGRLIDIGVSREKLAETFGHSGLARYEKMLAEKRRREGLQIDGEVIASATSAAASE